MYNLLFIGCFAPWRTNTSCEFFSDELSARFAALPHVNTTRIHFNEVDFPQADIALIHAYTSTPSIVNLEKLKTKVKKVVWFMEEPIQELEFDHYYFYEKKFEETSHKTYVKIPVVKSKYDILPKEPGTILLDHDSFLFANAGSPGHDWTQRIWDFFVKNKDKYRSIYQLERGPVDSDRPKFIKTIPMQSHQDYLKTTSRFETFICTHAGSYNHTAVDMAVRGTRVIVPESEYFSFVPRCLVNDLGLKIVFDENDLTKVLDEVPICVPQLEKATDLDDVVALMDSDFKQWTRKIIMF